MCFMGAIVLDSTIGKDLKVYTETALDYWVCCTIHSQSLMNSLLFYPRQMFFCEAVKKKVKLLSVAHQRKKIYGNQAMQ